MSIESVFDELSTKDVTQVDKEILLKVLAKDFEVYEKFLTNDKATKKRLQQENGNLLDNIDKKDYPQEPNIDIQKLKEAELLELQTVLTRYHQKLVALEERMNDKLDETLQEQNELFVKCQVLAGLLESKNGDAI